MLIRLPRQGPTNSRRRNPLTSPTNIARSAPRFSLLQVPSCRRLSNYQRFSQSGRSNMQATSRSQFPLRGRTPFQPRAPPLAWFHAALTRSLERPSPTRVSISAPVLGERRRRKRAQRRDAAGSDWWAAQASDASRVADPPGDYDFMRSVAAARDFAGRELTSGWTD